MSGTINPALGFTPAPQPNLLQQAGQVAQVGGQLQQFRREQETFGAQKQIGDALRTSLDPNTGELDANKFREAIAGNPMAAFLAPQALAQAKSLQLGAIQIQQAQAQVGMTRLNNLRQSLGGLLANPQVTRDDVNKAVFSLVSLPENERPFSAATAASQLRDLPNDPTAIRQWLLQHLLSTDQGIAHAQTFLPQPMSVNQGGQVTIKNRDPITGSISNAPGQSTLPMTPTPAERNEPTQTIGPDNRPRIQTRQDTLPMVDGQGSPLGGGRYPRPQGQGAPGPQANAGPPPSSAQVGFRPGEAAAQEIVSKEAAANASQLMTQSQETRNVDATLQNLDNLVQKFASGPAANWQRIGGAAWNRIAPGILQFDPKSIASQEEFNKQTLSLAAQQFKALGGTGTDGQLNTVLSTSPNELITRQGNRGIIAMLRGNNAALQVKAEEWQKWLQSGKGPETYSEFTTKFNREYDPRVFQSLYLDAAARKAMTNAMRPPDLAEYRRAWQVAIEKGWVDPKTLGAASNGR